MTDRTQGIREGYSVLHIKIEFMGRIVLLYCFDFRDCYFQRFFSAIVTVYIASRTDQEPLENFIFK